MASKGGSVGHPGHPRKQLRTHRHRPHTRPSRPPSAFTHNSPVQAPGREHFQGRARRCGPGSPARRESPEGGGRVPGCSEFRGPHWARRRGGRSEGALPPGAAPTTSGPRPRRLPLSPPRATLFILKPCAAPLGRRCHRVAEEQAGSTMRPAKPGGRPPKLGWGRIPPTYIFPPPRPPPALLSL